MTTLDGRTVRAAAVAGLFYPDDPRELRELVEGFLAEVDEQPVSVRAAMVPHAGLVYSGRCAAEVFGQIAIPRTVVIVAPNHFGVLSEPATASVWRSGAFDTPLGEVRIAEDLATEILDACALIAHDPIAHRKEHAIEVELPFLAILTKETKIVPILLAWDDWDQCEELAGVLANLLEGKSDEILLLASSDMTHYESATSAKRKDEAALGAIEHLDGKGLLGACHRKGISMCGRAAVATTLETARRLGADHASVVDYRHSGMVTGDDANVVSYAGVVIP
jgi:AmmeMemoRadiSam system protein B